MKKIPLILAVVGVAVVLFLAIFITLIDSPTSGPDFIEAIQSGKLDTRAVESIEVMTHQPAISFSVSFSTALQSGRWAHI